MRLLSSIIFLLILGCTSRPGSMTTSLDLSNKKLSAIPDSVFSLTELQYLELGNNFTLYPPLSALGEESSPGDSMNKIAEIPKDIEKLSHLRNLGLCFNDLRSLPKEIVKLEKLDTLDISFNQNLKIATELETLKQMQWLKYLNIIATNADAITIDKLRKSLSKTKIDAKPEDIMIENVDSLIKASVR
jgi:Leucine-rich repeat (LRR) protein